MKELPLRCSCGEVSMVDFLNLECRPVDQVASVEGFICPHCEKWESVFFTTVSLQENFARLQKLTVSTKYRKLFDKTLKKAENLQSRLREYGESKYNQLVIPR